MTKAWLACLAILGSAEVSAQQGKFPWKAGDPPPLVAGVPLGASRSRLDSLLGAPADSQELGNDGWAFKFAAKGLSIVYTPLDGAAVIYLLSRDAGEIGGVRLGDSKDNVYAHWGEPSTSEGPNSLYIAGKWVVVITVDASGKVVAVLGLGRVAGP